MFYPTRYIYYLLFFLENKLVFPLIFIYQLQCCIMKDKLQTLPVYKQVFQCFIVTKFEKLLRIFMYLKMSKNLSLIAVLGERNLHFINKKIIFFDTLRISYVKLIIYIYRDLFHYICRYISNNIVYDIFQRYIIYVDLRQIYFLEQIYF